jgi:serine/threonine protein kinase
MPTIAANSLVHDRYLVVRMIGRGGMGAVYEALDTRLQSRVALKQMTIQGPEVEQAFQREAHLLSGLRHPGLPRVIDYFDESSDRFLVMDYIEGQDLLELLRERASPLDVPTVLAWTAQILDVLVYLHGRTPRILHRDLKPANVKLTEGDRIVVIDFGLAKGALAVAAVSPQTTPSLFAASPQYAPLEQLRGTGTTNRSDLYALGATMFHLLTGAAPPSALDRSAAIVEGHRDPLIVWDEQSPLDAATRTIVRTAMRLNAADRYASAAEMQNAVSEAAAAVRARVPSPRDGVETVTAALEATIVPRLRPPAPMTSGGEIAQKAAEPLPTSTPSSPASPAVTTRWALRGISRSRLAIIGGGVVLVLALFWMPRVLPGIMTRVRGASDGRPAPSSEFVASLDAIIGPGSPGAGAGSIEVANATQVYLFDLVPEERVFIRTISYDAGLGALRVQFFDPDLREIVGTCLACGDLGVQAIAARGRHRLVVGGNDPATGTYRLGINRVPPPQRCVVPRTLVNGGAAAPATVDAVPETLGTGCGVIAVPGDTDVYELTVRAGEALRVSSLSLDASLGGLDLVLLDETGSVLSSTTVASLPVTTSVTRDGTLHLRLGSDRDPGTGRYALQFAFGTP